MPTFTIYEQQVIRRIAEHFINPGIVSKALALAGWPIQRLQEWAGSSNIKLLKKVNESVNKVVSEGVQASIKASLFFQGQGNVLSSFGELGIEVASLREAKNLPMDKQDQVCQFYNNSHKFILGAEGLIAGLATTAGEFIPYAQFAIPAIIAADVSLSMTFLSRDVCLIASCYGYDPRETEVLPHIMMAMAPINTSSDEGFLPLKGSVILEMRTAAKELAEIMANKNAKEILERISAEKAPALAKLVGYIAERLEIQLTEKELGLLVPLAGGILNGSMNIMFQVDTHANAQNYFAKLLLSERYGNDDVDNAVSEAISKIKNGRKVRP